MGNYNEDSIKVLSDIEHIIKRPTMYINSERPHYQMFTEIFDNSLDEAMNGHATSIVINIDYKSNSFSIEDNGRGIPQGLNKDLNIPTPQAIYLNLNSGGKYDRSSYGYSGGLNGVGSVVVNALSSYFILETWRGESFTRMVCSDGSMTAYDCYSRPDKKGTTGTVIRCQPNLKHKIFFDRFSDYESDIVDRIYLMKTLLPTVQFLYNSQDVAPRKFRDFLRTPASPLFDTPIELSGKDINIAFNWSQDNNKYLTKCFCNSVYNPSGGDHEKGVYDAILDVFGNQDYSLGISFAISVMYPDVEFDTQSKLKAVSKDLRSFVKESVSSLLKKFMKQNPESSEKIEELIKSKRKDIDKKNNKSNVKRNRRSAFLNNLGVSGFSDCTTKNREEAELFICEGNSAAGSAIQARNVETQAILPIRGKIINALNSDTASLLKNTEVATIMSNLNTGIFDDVDLKKSRYGKVIIFADADPDGRNISVLLLSLFITMTPEIVDAGMLYLALPPLYGTHIKGTWIPIYDEDTKNKYLDKGYEIQRYKGLGECNPEQLKVSCMNPVNRNILRIKSTPDCYDIIRRVAGSSSKARRELLIEAGILVE